MTRWILIAVLILAAGERAGFAGTQEGTDVRPVAATTRPADPQRLVPADEIDALAGELKPPARFAAHRPDWRVEERTFTFAHYRRTETSTWRVVMDGTKVVALVRSGDILLIARTPDTASDRIALPSERLHLDNLPGPSLPTWQFIKNVKTHGSIYAELGDKVEPREAWERGPASLTYVRGQDLPEYRVEARFVFTCDPVFGYRVDAVRQVDFTKPPEGKDAQIGGGAFCPGNYVPWDHATLYARTAWTPIAGGISGWANNLLCMDRCDGDRKSFAWRDGGFIAYLPGREGWSPVFTRKDGLGDTPSLQVCNAHNDFHIKFLLKDLPREGERYRLRQVNRLMSLPPELTAAVWDRMKLIQQDASGLILAVGRTETFEQQPVPLTKPARGLVWTSGEPELVKGIARSGERSILIKGRSWPNLPQVSLKPNQRYRLEGWFKVRAWTPEQRAAAKASDAARRADLSKKGKPLPPEIDFDRAVARAYIRGDYYEWSPYDGPILTEQRTTEATEAASTTRDGWQHVVLDFTSPDWAPFINIAFHADYCDAYLDDFALRELGADEK